MRHLISIALLAALPALAAAADNPDWAYPVTPRPEPHDNLVLKQVPGSSKPYTQAQIDDPFNPPDWFPDEHPPMPPIVATGGTQPAGAPARNAICRRATAIRNRSSIAGLPARYLIRQMAAFKNGDRKGVRATDDDHKLRRRSPTPT